MLYGIFQTFLNDNRSQILPRNYNSLRHIIQLLGEHKYRCASPKGILEFPLLYQCGYQYRVDADTDLYDSDSST